MALNSIQATRSSFLLEGLEVSLTLCTLSDLEANYGEGLAQRAAKCAEWIKALVWLDSGAGDQTAVTHCYRKLHQNDPHSHRSRRRSDCWPHTVGCNRAWNPSDSSCCLNTVTCMNMLKTTSVNCLNTINTSVSLSKMLLRLEEFQNSGVSLPQYCIFSSDLSLQWAIPSQVSW